MLDHQWHLTSEDGTVDFLFGTVDTGVQTSRAPDLGQRATRTRDVPLPREDGIAFGTDYEDGTLLTFEANVLTSGWAENSDLLNEWRAAWSARVLRENPEAYAILKVQNAGRIRRCYGRPRRFAEVDGDLSHEGYTSAIADFATRDGKFYADEVSTEQIPILPPTQFGFTAPITVLGTDPDTVAFQSDTLTPADQPGNVTVEGAETWAWVEIHGPVTNPSVQLGGLTLELDYTIPDGMSVLLDPRPWSRRVIRSDGANLGKHLTWQTPPMGEWLLKPGSYELVYRGTDATGTSFVTVNWREAFHRP